MHRLVSAAALVLAAAFVPSIALAAPAAPATLPAVKRSLASASTTDRTCHSSLYSGKGIARTTYRAPMSGFVTVRGAAKRGNWNLAVFDAKTRRAMTSSESFGSNEVAQTWVAAGQRLVIQGCRAGGKPSTFRLATTFVDAEPPQAAVPSLVRLQTNDDGILERLESLGFDVTHSMRAGYTDVIAPDADKLALLKKLGLKYDLLSSDLRKNFADARAADARQVRAAGKSPLPTGRETYRTYADYQTELAQLVKDHPGLVRPVTLGKSYQGRDIQGIEVADNVGAGDDGRPVYLLVALHHAREWPSAEIAMEFAHLVTEGFGNDAQITDLLRKERIVIVPIINPDGFVAARGTDPDPADTLMNNGGSLQENTDGTSPYDWDTVEGVFTPFGGNLAYRRKNCDTGIVEGNPLHSDAEQNLPCYYRVGVDPNRNYGYGWGGNGGSTDPNTQAYRGTSQWSEPETQAVWHWSQVHNVSMLITLHNVAALVLRPPGQHTDGLAPDEQRMKEIGDEMANATGYTSEYGWQLYDTTGTTEDWTYGGQGSFGYTIEIGPEGGKFHMPYETGVVKEWTGHSGREGHGMREALLIAAESAANPGDHSVVQGSAQPGAVLKLSKKFDTFSSPVCSFAQGNLTSSPDSPVAPLNCVAPGDRQSKPDKVEYTTVVPASGHYEWHVPPSTRPFVGRHVTPGELEDKPYEEPTVWKAEAADVRPDAQLNCPDDNAPCSTERRFSVTEEGTQIKVGLEWALAPQDFDLELYRVGDGGKLEEVDTSGNPSGVPESVTVPNAPMGEYVARVVYFLTGADQDESANDWTLTLSRFRKGPDKVETGREEYTLTCQTGDGTVLDTRSVYVARGQRVTEDLCGGTAVSGGAAGSPSDAGSVLGTHFASTNPPRKATSSKRARCMKKASKIKSKKKRKAAVRRCKKRYPTAAERRAAKKRALAKKRAAAKKRAHRRH
jgi:Zinc carboxypeptidase